MTIVNTNFDLAKHIGERILNSHPKQFVPANCNKPFMKRSVKIIDGVRCDVIYNIEPWEEGND